MGPMWAPAHDGPLFCGWVSFLDGTLPASLNPLGGFPKRVSRPRSNKCQLARRPEVSVPPFLAGKECFRGLLPRRIKPL